jgi:hypothetical protein
MAKNLRAIKTSFIISIVFISLLLSITPSAPAKLVTYESILQIEYDENAVNTAVFQPDGPPVSIPLTIRFKVEIPPAFIRNFALRILFLQTFIITSAHIRLSILNPPDWAAVSIPNADVYPDIDTEFQEVRSSVVIAAHDDAPAEGFVLNLKAEHDFLLNAHVAPQQAFLNINFQPGYIPLIDVYTEKPSRVVGPQEAVTFPIKITNLGNKQTLVTARIIDYPKGWAPLLSQSQIVIPAASDAGTNIGEMIFSITPPYGFGWHNELETITLEFTPEFSPPQPNTSAYTGTPVPFQVTIRNRGFSTPGFESIAVILSAIIVISILIKKRSKYRI